MVAYRYRLQVRLRFGSDLAGVFSSATIYHNSVSHLLSADISVTAGRFCLPHFTQGSTTALHSLQHQEWSDHQTLDHRSRSFPMSPVDTRDVVQGNVNPSHWPAEQEEQCPASKFLTVDNSIHSEQQLPISQRPPLCINSFSNLHSTPQSARRQSLDQDQAMISSCDSNSSETTTTKKRRTVLVWDLDETLILFHSLLSGVYASHHSPEVRQARFLCSCCTFCLAVAASASTLPAACHFILQGVLSCC